MRHPRIQPSLGLLGALLLLFALTISSAALGFGDSPPPAPDAPGPRAVGHTTFEILDADRDDRPLPIEAWYPTDPEDAVGEPTVIRFFRRFSTSPPRSPSTTSRFWSAPGCPWSSSPMGAEASTSNRPG